jgi:hypothetical protein
MQMTDISAVSCPTNAGFFFRNKARTSTLPVGVEKSLDDGKY